MAKKKATDAAKSAVQEESKGESAPKVEEDIVEVDPAPSGEEVLTSVFIFELTQSDPIKFLDMTEAIFRVDFKEVGLAMDFSEEMKCLTVGLKNGRMYCFNVHVDQESEPLEMKLKDYNIDTKVKYEMFHMEQLHRKQITDLHIDSENRMVWSISNDQCMKSFDLMECQKRWFCTLDDSSLLDMTVGKGVCYVGTEDGIIVPVRLSTSEPLVLTKTAVDH